MTPEELSAEEITLLTDMANNVDAEEAIAFIQDGNHLVEDAWLTAMTEWMETHYRIYIMVAYAHAQGKLKKITLSIPEIMTNEE